MKFIKILFKSIFLIFLFFSSFAFSNTLDKIQITGNDRISDETIKLFISVEVNEEINDVRLNNILKDLYETGFFKDISVKFQNQILSIKVLENPIIENIFYNGVKSSRILEIIKQGTLIKERSSYNKITFKKEKQEIENILKKLGYYNSSLEVKVNQKKNNLVNITYDIN